MGVTSGEVLVKAVKEADASPAPVSTWYLSRIWNQLVALVGHCEIV